MNAIGQPFWRDAGVIEAQKAAPACRVCGHAGHLVPVDPEVALALAVHEFNVDRNDLLSPRRFDELVEARAFVVWVLRSLGRPTRYARIGRILGGRDHSSIIHLHQKAIWLRLSDARFEQACEQTEQRFYNSRIHHNAH